MKNNPKELVDDLKIIRTIHSNRARKFSNQHTAYLVITVVIAVVVAFIGFSGPENIAEFINAEDIVKTTEIATVDKSVTSQENVEVEGVRESNYNAVALIMNLMILSILVISILGLIFRFEAKMNRHNSSVVNLTGFISDVEFAYLSDNVGEAKKFKERDLELYAERYKSLINSLPPTKDKHYFTALKTLKKKKRRKVFIQSEDYDSMNSIKRWWKNIWI